MTARIAGSICTFMSRFSAMLSLRALTQLLIQSVKALPMTVLQTLRIHYSERKGIETTRRRFNIRSTSLTYLGRAGMSLVAGKYALASGLC